MAPPQYRISQVGRLVIIIAGEEKGLIQSPTSNHPHSITTNPTIIISSSLASSTHIPDLANGRVHVARIRYEPMVDESVILTASFQAPAPTFFTDAEFPNVSYSAYDL